MFERLKKLNINGKKYVSLEEAESIFSKTLNVHFILDNSGSMTMVREATISGFNEYIQSLKNDGTNYRMTLTKFGNDYEDIYKNKSIKDVPELTGKTYKADGGGTALYDAVCGTIKKYEEAFGRHLVIIMTDGDENSSTEYSATDFKRLKNRLESTEQWTFVFLGANQDAWATARDFGFARQNVSSYNHTNAGTWSAMSNLARSTSNLSMTLDTNTKSFFSKEQQDEIETTV